MISTNYISIKSVLADLISTIDERYWNETVMLEWATKALRKIKAFNKFSNKLALIDLEAHRGQLPSDFVYVTQVAWKQIPYEPIIDVTLPNDRLAGKLNTLPALPNVWAPMRLTANPYFGAFCLDTSIMNCNTCVHDFSIDENLIITSSLCSGTIMVAYLAYPTNDAGDALMPDNEELKDAILHYILYRYWMTKYSMKEDGADQRMNFHLSMWSNLAAKAAGSLNMPDVNTLENIKNQRNRLIPMDNRFNQMFQNSNNITNGNF